MISTDHLPDREWANIFNPYGDIKHLRGNQLPVPGPFKPGHLNKNCDVPDKRQTNTISTTHVIQITKIAYLSPTHHMEMKIVSLINVHFPSP